MRQIKRSAYVQYSAKEMFLLVDDISAYPDFLPGCKYTEVHDRSDKNVIATIVLARSGIKSRFTTSNKLTKYDAIELSLNEGPFSYFEGGWSFINFEDKGSKIEFRLKFELKSSVLDLSLGSFFENICDKLVDAFVFRAKEIYK
ncbi:MAG: type II toxin-antitoxin system RatA family toxin [Pseudomonadota bacterium]|nr:type II toxin-antitoxin system RatA family toxin [Pseudomonadota bacterium]